MGKRFATFHIADLIVEETVVKSMLFRYVRDSIVFTLITRSHALINCNCLSSDSEAKPPCLLTLLIYKLSPAHLFIESI